jgi:AcrR family transcriptional regulator
MEVFAEKGYAATTVEDITRAAGASAATFYLHFRRKVDVLAAGVEDESRTVYSAAGSLWPVAGRPTRESLQAWAACLFGHWQDLSVTHRVLGQAVLIEPELRGLQTRRLAEGITYWEAFLRDVGAPPGRHTSAEAALVNAQFVGLFEMWIVSELALDKALLVDLVAAALLRHVETHAPTH